MPLPRIAISLGDPSGIGPEVVRKSLPWVSDVLVPVIYGDSVLFRRELRRTGLPIVSPGSPLPNGGALVEVTRLSAAEAKPGRPSLSGARAQLAFLEAAFQAVRRGSCDALCTAPVSKAQVQRALPGFVGHTEWLTERAGPRARSVMMLAGDRLKVALVTNHLALRELFGKLTAERVARTITIVHRALTGDFGVARPRIALAALNPHGGEGGAFGADERTLLVPALRISARRGAPASGPFPADSVFFRAALGEFDAVVALYHDQGLIPVKLLDTVLGDPAVNVTLGLPFVRTSPDHGVAYDRAGRNVAKPESMIAALRLAAKIARVRARQRRREEA